MLHPVLTRPVVATLLAASFVCTPVAALAQSCDAGTEARLEFIETRLEEARSRELLWWRSWLAVFSIGAVYGVVAGQMEDNNEIAVANYVTSAKSVLGIADLSLRPHLGRHGAARIRAIPKTSAESCAERLRLAEETLEVAGEQANIRWSWKRHMSSLVLNLGAAVAVAEGADEPEQAWRDFAVSEVSAEVHIWTHPTRNHDNWEEYRQKFNGAPAAALRPTWRIAATPGGGVGVVWKF